MTEKEALELLKDHEYWTTYSWQDEMCEIAIKALEKQISKKAYDVEGIKRKAYEQLVNKIKATSPETLLKIITDLINE